MDEKINLIKENGATVASDVICFLEDTESNKRYIYYTLNEIVGEGPSSTIKIYVAKVKQNNELLDTAINDNEWNKLKSIMGSVLKGENITSIKYLPLSMLDYNIISEKVIAMPISYDYINKHRGIYAETVAIADNLTVENNANTLEKNDTLYTITFIAGEHGKLNGSQTVFTNIAPNTTFEQAGIVIPTPVADENYMFVDWAPSIVENVTESVIYTANFAAKNEEVSNVPINNEYTPDNSDTVEKTNNIVDSPVQNENLSASPISIEEIENKYNEMINIINQLKEKEIEAINRYNATLKLNEMHNEQHASYIASEQEKSNINLNNTAATNNVLNTTVNEPTPISMTVPEPESNTNVNIETNWFDIPQNN